MLRAIIAWFALHILHIKSKAMTDEAQGNVENANASKNDAQPKQSNNSSADISSSDSTSEDANASSNETLEETSLN